MLSNKAVDGTVDVALEPRKLEFFLDLPFGERPEFGDSAVYKHDRHRKHLIDRFAVLDAARARRVVRYHPADVGAVGGGHVWGELEFERFEKGVKRVAHHPRLHPNGARRLVELQNLV